MSSAVAPIDYTSLDEDTRAFMQGLDEELDLILKRTPEEVGRILLKAKKKLPHGMFRSWHISKGISRQTAWRCIQAARGKESKVSISRLLPLQSSESNEWYTPAQYVESVHELMGGIDLDPASSASANKIICAKSIYTQEDNGLAHPWFGRVWLNPPYGFEDDTSNQEIWTHFLIGQFEVGNVIEAVLLVNANTEAKWFNPLYDYPICFTDHRIHFYSADGESSQPTQGNAFVYFGPHRKRFIEIFSRFGVVVERAKLDESRKNRIKV